MQLLLDRDINKFQILLSLHNNNYFIGLIGFIGDNFIYLLLPSLLFSFP